MVNQLGKWLLIFWYSKLIILDSKIKVCIFNYNKKKNDMNTIEKMKDLLNQVKQLADDNIENAHNFDLEDFSQVIENYIDELEEIEDFETYED